MSTAASTFASTSTSTPGQVVLNLTPQEAEELPGVGCYLDGIMAGMLPPPLLAEVGRNRRERERKRYDGYFTHRHTSSSVAESTAEGIRM